MTDPLTGMEVPQWHENDRDALGKFLNRGTGKKLIALMQFHLVQEGINAANEPNAERAVGVVFGYRKGLAHLQSLSVSGLSPTNAASESDSTKRASDAALLAAAGLSHLGH